MKSIRWCASVVHTFFLIIFAKIKIIFRRAGIAPKSRRLRELKNKFNGRCFIVCTGASLRIQDIELLQDEITISMNSICYLYANTEWRPTFYIIQDGRAFSEMNPLFTTKSVNICNEQLYRKNKKRCKELDFLTYFLDYGLHGSRLDKKNSTKKFSADCSVCINDGYTVTYSALQLAMFMGFTEIVLLGCDCNLSSSEKKHFITMKNDNSLDWTGQDSRMKNAYLVAKNYADKHGVNIINATKGGNLDIFERVDLRNILSSNEGI